MTTTASDVLTGAGAGATDTALATTVLAEAVAHTSEYINRNLIDTSNQVPTTVNDAAVLQCALDLFARRKAPFGQQVMPDANGTLMTTRLGADPLGGVRSMLRPWCLEIGFSYPEDDS